MPTECCVKGCKHRIDSCRFKKFPKKQSLVQQWVNILTNHNEYYRLNTSHRVCHCHFSTKHFAPCVPGEPKTLFSDAVPDLLLPPGVGMKGHRVKILHKNALNKGGSAERGNKQIRPILPRLEPSVGTPSGSAPFMVMGAGPSSSSSSASTAAETRTETAGEDVDSDCEIHPALLDVPTSIREEEPLAGPPAPPRNVGALRGASLTGLCRVCAKLRAGGINEIKPESAVARRLSELLDITIESGGPLPNAICGSCLRTIIEWQRLQEAARKARVFFQGQLELHRAAARSSEGSTARKGAKSARDGKRTATSKHLTEVCLSSDDSDTEMTSPPPNNEVAASSAVLAWGSGPCSTEQQFPLEPEFVEILPPLHLKQENEDSDVSPAKVWEPGTSRRATEMVRVKSMDDLIPSTSDTPPLANITAKKAKFSDDLMEIPQLDPLSCSEGESKLQIIPKAMTKLVIEPSTPKLTIEPKLVIHPKENEPKLLIQPTAAPKLMIEPIRESLAPKLVIQPATSAPKFLLETAKPSPSLMGERPPQLTIEPLAAVTGIKLDPKLKLIPRTDTGEI